MKRSGFARPVSMPNAEPKVRMKKCALAGCDVRFVKLSMKHRACCTEHALQVVQNERERVVRKADKARKQAMEPIAKLANRAQAVVNRYVRLRDIELPCISCDRPANWDGQWHASHYKSRGANSALRFNLWNLHKSCSICNNHLSGNIGEYRPRLIERIGADRVELLDCHERLRKYDAEYLHRLMEIFTKKIQRLKSHTEKYNDNET